jgi:hypothetical protein
MKQSNDMQMRRMNEMGLPIAINLHIYSTAFAARWLGA